MKAVYTGLFTPHEDHVSVHVPDMPSCITFGRDLADALNMAADALNEILIVMEDEHLPIPEPRPLSEIEVPDGAIPSMIVVDTELKRIMDDARAVRKNISMPVWMAYRVDQLGLNLSQFVQEALRAQFGFQPGNA